MKHKVFGYYETGEELLVPITGWRAAVVRVEEAGKNGCMECCLRDLGTEACLLFPCAPGQREDGKKVILRKVGEAGI